MQIYGLSHQGMVRENNEDSFAIYKDGVNRLKNLAVIADGMGGHQSGEVASYEAIASFIQHIEDIDMESGDIMDYLNESVQYANEQVYLKSLSAPQYYGMGTTFTACVIDGDKGYVAHVGDSRLYIRKNDNLILITSDHTYVNEMVRMGHMTEAEASVHPRRNALTKALGVDGSVEVDGYLFDFNEGDTIIICSDGLTNMVSEEKIAEIVDNEGDVKKCAEELVLAANENGGIDNITVILMKA